MLLDPNSSSLPRRRDLPQIPNAPKNAAWFWGDKDQVREAVGWCMIDYGSDLAQQHGRLNLLTPQRIAKAAQSVKLGDIVPLK